MTNEVRVISYIIGSDSDYYNLHHFTTFSVPTADTLFLLILSILALESAHSIRFLYQHFLSRITEKSLNVFYYACSYAKIDHSRFMNTTVRIVLKLIPDSLQTQPVFLCVDDTMVSKFDTKFENVSKLFQNLDLIGNARIDSVMYVPAPAHTGRIGRPAKHGKRLTVETSYYEQKTFCLFVTIWCEAAKGLKCLSI